MSVAAAVGQSPRRLGLRQQEAVPKGPRDTRHDRAVNMTVQNQFGTGFGEYSSKVSRIAVRAAARCDGEGVGRVVNKHDPNSGVYLPTR